MEVFGAEETDDTRGYGFHPFQDISTAVRRQIQPDVQDQIRIDFPGECLGSKLVQRESQPVQNVGNQLDPIIQLCIRGGPVKQEYEVSLWLSVEVEGNRIPIRQVIVGQQARNAILVV